MLDEYQKVYALIISEFLADKEKETKCLRYICRGFDFSLVEEIAKNLEKKFSIKIKVISPDKNYNVAIKSRASTEPTLIYVASRKVSEHSSLFSTFKSITNVFYSFEKRWKKVEGIYNLYDITEWLFQQDKLDYIANKFLLKSEYSARKKILERSFNGLKALWDQSLTNPSLRNRLAPGSIAKIFVGISQSQEYSFNDLVQAIGFAPSLSVPQDDNSLKAFYSNSRNLFLLLKGTDADKKSKLAKLCENSIAGLLLFYKNSNDSRKVPKDLDLVLQHYTVRDEKGRRIWVVRSSDVEIKEYSLDSGLVKKVLFKIRNRKTKEKYIFNDAWNLCVSNEQLPFFFEFLRDENVGGPVYSKYAPFELIIRNDEIYLTFNFLEGYLFCRKDFRRRVDEIQI